ncbi:MAG: tryptophan--tRNA ligase [Halobacteria archaeon]
MPEQARLDPWGRAQIADYEQLIRDFGIEPFGPLLAKVPRPMRLMARSIIFGHRDYGRVLAAMAARKPFGVISGFMPSGRAHLGAKMVMEEIVWHQQMGGDATVAIADMEAHAVRGISWEKCREWGINEYALSLIAIGLKPDRVKVYFQSENRQVQDLAFRLAKEANYSELRAIYGFSGETTLAHMLCPAVQAADILAPQLPENGGPRPLVVPVGGDQDPHIRLARDLGARMNPFVIEEHPDSAILRWKDDASRAIAQQLKEAYQEAGKQGKIVEHKQHIEFEGRLAGALRTLLDALMAEGAMKWRFPFFVPPAGLYHRFMTGLTGGKMSSSVPESHIALSEAPKEAETKVLKAKTGGRATEREQREKGGEWEKCTVYELMECNLDDDKGLKEMRDLCKSGKRLCGPCKKWAAGEMRSILTEHQEKREAAREQLDEFGLKPAPTR